MGLFSRDPDDMGRRAPTGFAAKPGHLTREEVMLIRAEEAERERRQRNAEHVHAGEHAVDMAKAKLRQARSAQSKAKSPRQKSRADKAVADAESTLRKAEKRAGRRR